MSLNMIKSRMISMERKLNKLQRARSLPSLSMLKILSKRRLLLRIQMNKSTVTNTTKKMVTISHTNQTNHQKGRAMNVIQIWQTQPQQSTMLFNRCTMIEEGLKFHQKCSNQINQNPLHIRKSNHLGDSNLLIRNNRENNFNKKIDSLSSIPYLVIILI